MTYSIDVDSPRREAAARFSRALDQAMKRRGVSKRGLSIATGMTRTLISLWALGQGLPRIESADKLATSLEAPELSDLIREVRLLTCPVDGTRFEWAGGGPAVYCSDACRKVNAKFRNDGQPKARKAQVLERRLSTTRAAIAAFCHSCEPDGQCRNAVCELRSVSPLRLVGELPVVQTAPRAVQGPLTPEGRRRRSAALAERWERPGERERFSRLMADRHAARRATAGGVDV